MAQDKTQADAGRELDPRVRELHTSLLAALGGPPVGGELQSPYWDVRSTAFEDVVHALLDDAEPGTAQYRAQSRSAAPSGRPADDTAQA